MDFIHSDTCHINCSVWEPGNDVAQFLQGYGLFREYRKVVQVEWCEL